MTGALRKRIVTALVLAALAFAILLLLPPVATKAALTLLALAGAWEWSAFLRLSTPVRRAAYVLLVALLLADAWWVSATTVGLDLVLAPLAPDDKPDVARRGIAGRHRRARLCFHRRRRPARGGA